MIETAQVVLVIASTLGGGIGAWLGLRVELRYLRREVREFKEDTKSRLTDHTRRIRHLELSK